MPETFEPEPCGESVFAATGEGSWVASGVGMPDGGWVLAGGAAIDDGLYSRITAWVARFDAAGEPVWQTSFELTDGIVALEGLAAMDDGGLVIGGRVEGREGPKSSRALVLRLDGAGATLWEQILPGDGVADGVAVAPLADGGVVVVGSTSALTGTAPDLRTGSSDLWVARLAVYGAVAWERTYGGDGYDRGNAVVVDGDDGIVVGGQSDFDEEGTDGWVMRLDSDGNVVWENREGGPGGDKAIGLALLPDGGVVVAGEYRTDNVHEDDAWIYRIDATGRTLWSHAYHDVDSEEAVAVVPLGDKKGFVLGAISDRNYHDVWLIRVGDDGSLRGSKRYGVESADERTKAAFPRAGGGFVVVADRFDDASMTNDAWVLHLGAGDCPSE